jgi:hypothetical protein
MGDDIFLFLSSFLSFDIENFLDIAGQNPFAAMWIIMKSGGWILLAWFALIRTTIPNKPIKKPF